MPSADSNAAGAAAWARAPGSTAAVRAIEENMRLGAGIRLKPRGRRSPQHALSAQSEREQRAVGSGGRVELDRHRKTGVGESNRQNEPRYTRRAAGRDVARDGCVEGQGTAANVYGGFLAYSRCRDQRRREYHGGDAGPGKVVLIQPPQCRQVLVARRRVLGFSDEIGPARQDIAAKHPLYVGTGLSDQSVEIHDGAVLLQVGGERDANIVVLDCVGGEIDERRDGYAPTSGISSGGRPKTGNAAKGGGHADGPFCVLGNAERSETGGDRGRGSAAAAAGNARRVIGIADGAERQIIAGPAIG